MTAFLAPKGKKQETRNCTKNSLPSVTLYADNFTTYEFLC